MFGQDCPLVGGWFPFADRLIFPLWRGAEMYIPLWHFGMVKNMELEGGGFMVGKHAYLTINCEADLVEE